MELPENLTPLIDGDWILYNCCQAIEYNWEDKAEEQGFDPLSPPPFHLVRDLFIHKMETIALELQTETAPTLFFTGANNFRKDVAKTKKYKGNRDKEKPFHYEGLKEYIEDNFNTKEVDTLEADDLLAITQTQSCGVTIIVSVDKDLRQVDGWHYSPEGYNYPSFGPRYCNKDNSYIQLKDPSNPSKGIIGTGYKFFYCQLLTGDAIDNIPGLPKHGPAKALQILEGCESELACYLAVRDAYRDTCLMADDYLQEQADLLWMVRDLHIDGTPVRWSPPDGD